MILAYLRNMGLLYWKSIIEAPTVERLRVKVGDAVTPTAGTLHLKEDLCRYPDKVSSRKTETI